MKSCLCVFECHSTDGGDALLYRLVPVAAACKKYPEAVCRPVYILEVLDRNVIIRQKDIVAKQPFCRNTPTCSK